MCRVDVTRSRGILSLKSVHSVRVLLGLPKLGMPKNRWLCLLGTWVSRSKKRAERGKFAAKRFRALTHRLVGKCGASLQKKRSAFVLCHTICWPLEENAQPKP